jgi:ubiquitin C-terminal hydrolase
MKTLDFEYYFYNEDLIKQSNIVYDLKGIIYYNLYGEDFGHYSASFNINGNWYYSDDESLIPEEEPKTYANGHVVLLFYEKKN